MKTDPIVLAKALAAARINVRGTGRTEYAKPGAAKEADRKPNWNKWRLIPNLAPWQCAALWANIDPDKVKFIRDAWMAEGSIHRFAEAQDFKDRLELIEANQYGALKSQGRSSYDTVELRLLAAWVRETATGWGAPPELLAMADGHDPGKQKTPKSAAGRAHNKRKTEARNLAWQERINNLAQDSHGKSHSDYCRTLAKEAGVPFHTIRRNTKLGHS